MFASSVGYAATADITGTVEEVFVDDQYYGGCMAKISEDIADKLPTCQVDYVTFDCLAAFPETTKSIAVNKLSISQLAFVTRKTVYVRVTDLRRANGYCLAERIDIIN